MTTFRLAPLAVPLALAVAGGVTAAFRTDGAQAATTLALTALACGVLAPLAATARRSSAVVPAAALAAFLALAFLPRGVPLAAAAVSGVLVVALGAELAGRTRGSTPPQGAVLAGLIYATQVLAAGDRLFAAPWAAATLFWVVAVPLAVAWALARVARLDAPIAWTLGLAGAASGPGWGTVELVVLAGATALLGFAPVAGRPRVRALVAIGAAALPFVRCDRFGAALALALAAVAAAGLAPQRSLALGGRSTLAGLALAALAAGALPWRSPAPLETVVRSLALPPFAVVDRPVRADAVVLTEASPVYEAPLTVGEVRAVTVVSYLSDAVALPCGVPIARLELHDAERAVAEMELQVGRDSAEWATQRPDVAAALACPAPPSHWSWIPAEGRFFGSSYRARFRQARPVAADRLRIARDPALPPGVGVALFFVGVER